MTEEELKAILSANIKKYRKGRFTQETLAEKIGVSSQNINDVEGKRRFPRIDSLVKIADALNVEVYQLFIPEQKEQIVFEETPEIDLIRRQLNSELICNFRKSMNRFLDKIEDSFWQRFEKMVAFRIM